LGDTIWVDVQGRSKGELPRDNSIMLRLKDELDRLSDKLSVPKLSRFCDYSELKAHYADFAEEPNQSDSTAEAVAGEQSGGVWFDPAPALAAVRAIHDHLAQRPENLDFLPDPKRRHWPDSLIEELKECQTTLEAAVSQGRLFRFLVLP
jgi:hypothetical protein